MDLRGVVRAVNDGTEIYGIYLGTIFVWPDPWTDIWDEGSNVYWDPVWHDMWTMDYSEFIPVQVKESDGSQ